MAIDVDGAAFENHVAFDEGYADMFGDFGRDDVVVIPRRIFFAPSVEGEVLDEDAFVIARGDKNGAGVAHPSVVAGDDDGKDVGKAFADFTGFDAYLVGGFFIIDEDVNFFMRAKRLDNFDINFLHARELAIPRPRFDVERPSEPGCFVRFPFRRHPVVGENKRSAIIFTHKKILDRIYKIAQN